MIPQFSSFVKRKLLSKGLKFCPDKAIANYVNFLLHCPYFCDIIPPKRRNFHRRKTMEDIRIQDNLYMHVNQETLDRLVIPDDRPSTGGFAELAEGVEKIMMGEFEDMAASGSYPNEYLERACKLYAIAKDAEAKEKHGIAPALKALSILNEY